MPTLLIAWLVANPGPELGLDSFNSPANEIKIAYTADLDEAWIERRSGIWGESGHRSRLLHSVRDTETGRWSVPVPVPFSATDSDEGEPFFDDAARTLYFTSDRVHPDLPDSSANIWRVQRGDGAWQAPEPLPAPVNGPGAEYSPVRRGQRLYFASYRDGGGDLHVAQETAGRWQVSKLGPAVNTSSGEWNLWVSDSEDLMLFEASGRSTNISASGDLYASATDDNGDWLPAVPLSAVNGPGSDLNAQIAGGRLVYAGNSAHPAHTDLYAVSADAVRDATDAAWAQSLLVVNRSSHTVAAVDLASGRVASIVPIGPGPHLISERGGRFAVTAYGVYPRPHDQAVDTMPGWVEAAGGSLLVGGGRVDRTRLRCNRPHGTAWDDDGERLWVSCENRNGVIEIDYSTSAPVYRLLRTNHDGAHVLAWDSERDQLLVAHTEDGGIAFVNPRSGHVEFLNTGAGSEALWIDPERREAWVTIGPAGELAVIDLERRLVIDRVDPGCSFPIDFAHASDGRLWVACFGSGEIVALSPGSRDGVDRVPLPAGPLNIEAHPSLPVVYASLPRQNRVVEISLAGRGITRSFETGIEPDGLALLATDGR